MPRFPWFYVGILAFWCVVAGIFLGDFLPLRPMPRGPILIVLVVIIVLGVLRSVWGMRRAVNRWRSAARVADRE